MRLDVFRAHSNIEMKETKVGEGFLIYLLTSIFFRVFRSRFLNSRFLHYLGAWNRLIWQPLQHKGPR